MHYLVRYTQQNGFRTDGYHLKQTSLDNEMRIFAKHKIWGYTFVVTQDEYNP